MQMAEVKRLLGLSSKAIYLYEEQGLVRAERLENGYREFDEENVERLRTVKLFRDAGISLGDIRLWFSGVLNTGDLIGKRRKELAGATEENRVQTERCAELERELHHLRAEEKPLPAVSLSSERALIGIDIGTTNISATVLTGEKWEQKEAFCFPNSFPVGTEKEKAQDADVIAEKAVKLTDYLLACYPGTVAIGITGQMHGILYLDEDGNALSPLYTWQNELGEELYSPERTYCEEITARTGIPVSTGFGIVTAFYHLNHGGLPAGTAKICTATDYVSLRLCGRKTPLCHVSNGAGMGLFDVREKQFRTDAVEKLGLSPEILPQVTADSVFAGTHNGIPVAVGIGDTQATYLGSTDAPGQVLVNFGTGSQILVSSREWSDRAEEVRPFVDGQYLLNGAALCGGRAYALLERFFRDYAAVCGGADVAQYDIMDRLAQEGIGAPLKIRTTFCGTRKDPKKRGQITEIDEENFTPAALIGGVLYGMAEELHQMYRDMAVPATGNVLIASGNAVRKNAALRTVLSRVFGLSVVLPAVREEAAVGAARFALSVSARSV